MFSLSLLLLLTFISCCLPRETASNKRMECLDCLPLGVIFDQDYEELNGAFIFAVEEYNKNLSSQRHKINAYVDIISTRDFFKIARRLCNSFSLGVYAMVASVNSDSFNTIHSYANSFHMPFVTTGFPEKVPSPSSGLMDYAICMRPDYHAAVVDLIGHYKWNHIIYIYDSDDGLLRLQRIFQSLTPAKQSFEVRAVQQIKSAGEAMRFLRNLESVDRWSQKHVVLDCSAALAKALVQMHVRDVHMGRRNYHFLFTGLILDDHWEEGIEEYGAVNITGLRIVDPSSDKVKDFLSKWRSLDPRQYSGAGNFISAKSALIYDAVQLTMEAVVRTQRRAAHGFRAPRHRSLCSLNDSLQDVWHHGEEIARQMRKVKFEGLTGNINFTEEGRRSGFSLDVVEMTTRSQVAKIGTWSDSFGLQLLSPPSFGTVQSGAQDKKVLIVTSILDPPFLMERQGGEHSGNERFEGYVKDLADLLAEKVSFNYSLRLVEDSVYGSFHEGQWTGMIGELVRREADVAIAPLTITSARESAIEFTKPFMTTGISIMIKKPAKQIPNVFSFMLPLSKEIWLCAFFAYIGVAIVLFLVSRFSPDEWKMTSLNGKSYMTNDFTVCNSMWFALAALVRHNADLYPRSLPGRMVGSVWWFFTLMLIASYTANLAAFLTVERLATPVASVDDLVRQTEVEYGLLEGGSTQQFFQRSKVSVYAKMWEFMASRRHVFVPTTQGGLERVRSSKGKFAFLLESTRNEYINGQLPCDTMKLGENLNSIGYGVATPKGSGLRDALNMAILEIEESGILDKLKERWWRERSQCQSFGQEHRQDSLSLGSVAGIFYILTLGLVVSLILAVMEFCWRSRTNDAVSELSISEAIKGKGRLSTTTSGISDSSQHYLASHHLPDGSTIVPSNAQTHV